MDNHSTGSITRSRRPTLNNSGNKYIKFEDSEADLFETGENPFRNTASSFMEKLKPRGSKHSKNKIDQLNGSVNSRGMIPPTIETRKCYSSAKKTDPIQKKYFFNNKPISPLRRHWN